MNEPRSEIKLAVEIVRVLHGVSIKQAQEALARAETLLLTTQTVQADSAALAVAIENDTALSS